jgi:hypothetical protein
MPQPFARRWVGEYDLKTALLARAGDKTALEKIHGREAPWSLRAAYRIVHQPDISDDAIQDAFTQVWHEAHGFDPNCRPVGLDVQHCTQSRFKGALLPRSIPITVAAPLRLENLRATLEAANYAPSDCA